MRLNKMESESHWINVFFANDIACNIDMKMPRWTRNEEISFDQKRWKSKSHKWKIAVSKLFYISFFLFFPFFIYLYIFSIKINRKMGV